MIPGRETATGTTQAKHVGAGGKEYVSPKCGAAALRTVRLGEGSESDL